MVFFLFCFDISFLHCPCLFKDAQNVDAVMTLPSKARGCSKGYSGLVFGGIHTLGQVANVHKGSCLGSSIESQDGG